MKHIPQYEFNWTEPEPLSLVPQVTVDLERVAREQRQMEVERKKQEKKQGKFNGN